MKHKIIKEDNAQQGRFYMQMDDDQIAEITYFQSENGPRICNHTYVPDRYRGQGVAFELLDALIADARSSGQQYVPLCPYVASEFRRHPEWSDVFVGR